MMYRTSSWFFSAHVKQVIFWAHSHHNIKPHTANDILVGGATSRHLKTMSPLGLTSPWHMSKIFSVSLRMLRAICSRASTRDLRSDPISMWHRKSWRQTWPSACREYIEYLLSIIYTYIQNHYVLWCHFLVKQTSEC